MDKKIIVLGAGGHAKVVLDILRLNHMEICGLIDAGYQSGQSCLGVPVLGTDAVLPQLSEQGIHSAAMGIGHVGNPDIRNHVYEMALNLNYSFPNIIHPKSVLSKTISMGEGNLFAAQCVVNADAVVGNLCIVNTAAVVEHDVVIEDGVHVAPHATLLGMVHVGKNSFIGAGSVVLQGVTIGCNCIIGAGAVVRKDVSDNSIIVGNPGKQLTR